MVKYYLVEIVDTKTEQSLGFMWTKKKSKVWEQIYYCPDADEYQHIRISKYEGFMSMKEQWKLDEHKWQLDEWYQTT